MLDGHGSTNCGAAPGLAQYAGRPPDQRHALADAVQADAATRGVRLKAFSAVCTHLDCIVQYRPEMKGIWCACHNGQYDLNGQNTGGPPPRPLEEYAVNLRGDEVIVSKA